MATNLEGNFIGREGLRLIVGWECSKNIKYLNLGIIVYLGRSKSYLPNRNTLLSESRTTIFIAVMAK